VATIDWAAAICHDLDPTIDSHQLD